MTKNNKNDKNDKKIFFQKRKIFFQKKKLSKKNFTKKSIQNYQKINNKLSGTDRQTDIVRYRVA